MTPESLFIALATLLLTKAGEKIGENIGDALWNNPIKQLGDLVLGKNKVPSLTSDEQERLDYGQAVLELKAAVDADPKIAEAVIGVEAAVNNDQSETTEEIKS